MNAKLTLAGITALVLVLGIGDFERGNRLYRAGRYAEAVEAYRAALEDAEEPSPELHYNLGTALLRLGRMEEAEQHLASALASVDPELRERTLFNLGTRFLAEGREAQSPADRARLLDAAVQRFKDVLRLDPSHADAKWNLELSLRERDDTPPVSGEQPEQQDPSAQQGNGGQPPRPGGSERPDRPAQAPGEMSREQAERILNAVEQDERDLYAEQLRANSRDRPVLRDW